MKWGKLLILGAALALPLSGAAQYINSNMVVLDINFDTDTIGATPVLASPPPYPSTHPEAYGAFVNIFTDGLLIYTETNGVTFRVEDAAGMTKALVMSNAWPASATDTTIGFVDHTFGGVPVAARSRLEFDFSQLQTPSGTNAGFRSDWLVVAFKVNATPSQRAFTIGTRHGYPGQIYLQQESGVNVPIGTYTNGLVTHVEIVTYNEGTGRYDVYLNGNLAAQNVAFHNPMTDPSDQITEIFIQQVAAEGSVNVVAFDNLKYTLLIPEPTPMLLTTVGMLGLVPLIRRQRRYSV